MLSLKNITKDYYLGGETVKALKGVRIEFRESEFVSILGPSGCGKTTLLNIIGGLDRYTDGDLIINGKSTKEFKDADWDSYRNHSIGFVFQSYNLIPHQTVLANVELALTLSGVPKSERRRRAKEALEQVGLGDQLNKKPNQMSGGQMQRVAIARALVNDPDILLADEPTGALDTETSVQIMEILKKISKDKLIIMVTHNPELATKYSSRIINLLDGVVTDDSDPYDRSVVEPIKKPDKELTKEEKKRAKKERKKLKTSMSFPTALSLSRNNLMTKKARTLLTSFAGSIGIIGIALILSISNGVQNFIDKVQSDTLSTYPLEISETTASISEIMNSMASARENAGDHDKDKIYSQNQMSTMINTLMSETKVNNLKDFKVFIDNNEEIKDLVSDIKYGYSTTLNVFRTDTDEDYMQVNPSQLLLNMGYINSTQMAGMSMGGSMMMGTDVWTELLDNDELNDSQYDILAGRMPEKMNEVVFIVDENNESNDYVLYSLGILDPTQLNGIVLRALSGEDISLNSEQQSYTYDEIMNIKFKLIPSTAFYRKGQDGLWKNMSDDNDYMLDVINDGLDIEIVGILRPSEDATATSISGGIAYRHDLMEYIVGQVENSDIIKEQLADPTVDVLSGKKFKPLDGSDTETDDSSEADSAPDAGSSGAENAAGTDTDDSSAEGTGMPEGMPSDEELAAIMNAQVPELSEEELGKLMEILGEEKFGQLMNVLAAQEMRQAGGMGLTGIDMEGFENYEEISGGTDPSVFIDQGLGGLSEAGVAEGGMGFDTNGMTETSKQLLDSLDDEQKQLLMAVLQEYMAGEPEDISEGGKYSSSSYDQNLQAFGYSTLDKPSSISIYPKDFASKEKIIDIIEDYNKSVPEEDQIEYTDFVGLMMSSITSIINAISYVLIAFVAISLIVSSIMIGIITYISVLERTKEIGILRAIGASKKDISRVFNAETVIVGFVAGVLGIGISMLLTIPINAIIRSLTDVPIRASIPWLAAVILIAISVLLTLIAGLFPAKVAAKKDPVIALRTE